MSKNPFADPNFGASSTPQLSADNPFADPNFGKEQSRGVKGVAQDVAATAVKAALAVPEAAVGVADLVTGGKAGKALEGVGVRFKEAREIAEGWHSDVTKAQKAEFQNADGVAGKAAVALSNPSLIAMAVGESLGAMGAGGAIGRGAMAATRLGQMGAKGAAIAGAAGEGVVGAGSAAEQIRQETADGELTAKQAALAAGTGLATGALGFAGNKVANRLGIGDADMMLAQGTKGMAKDAAERATAAAVNPLAQPAQKTILRQMGEGAITEGVLEELPQSVSEQILQNEALGKSWSEGLDDAIVMGILSGGAMGAGAAGYRGLKDKQIDDAAANARKAAANVPGAATGQDSAAGGLPPAQWTTSAGAAARAEPGTAPASSANAPNLDYETLPGAAPEAVGKEIPFEREFDTGGLSLQSTQPAAAAPVLDHDALRDKAGVMMPPQLDSGRIEVATGLQPLSNEQPPRQWDTGNLSLVDESQPQVPLSQRMGLNPKAGALSKAAAMAVDSGASPVGQPQVAPMAEQQAAPQVPAGVDPDTGEVSLQAQMDELKSRIAFMQQQGAAQGWDRNRAAQRNALQTQLTKLELQAVKASSNPQTFRGGVSNPNGDGFEWTPERLAFAKKMLKQVEFGIETGIGVRQIAQRVQFPAGTTIEERERFVRQAADRFGLVIPESRTDEEEMASQMEERREARHDLIPTGGRAAIPGTDDIRFMSSEDLADYREKIRQDAKAGVLGAKKASLAAWEEQAARLDELKQRKLAGALSVDPVKQVSQAAGAAQAAVGKAAQIAREGNAEREAQRQRQLDASERWTRMTTVERQAVAATAPGLNAIARKNVHTRAWPDLGEKIREKLLDSLVAPLAESTSKAPAAIENAANPATNAVSGDALPKPAAQPVGDEKPFAAETGTLGIPRAEMPQVPTANHGGLVKHLKARGIAHETTTVDAAQLKPTQAEYSPSKVEAAKSATGDRAVIVSNDGHIIDGHHQAVAAAEEGKQVKAIVLDAPVEKALAAVKASPSANTEAVAAPLQEPVTVPKSVPQRMKEAKAAKEATTKPAPNDGRRKQDLTSAQELVQGQIENRERQRNEAWARVKQLRAAVKEGTANRLQLLKAEDAHRSLVREVDGMRAKGDPRFRRQESEQLAGAAFDVASFLQGMGEGQPANVSAAAVPAVNVRPSYSPAARAEAVRAVKGTADAIRKAWANGPEVIVAFDMHDAVVPESARRADLKQRSGGARGAPEGFYYQGKVYLMASKLKTPNDAARVLFHEALGHHGLRGLFGKDLGLILNQVATMRKADVDAKIAEYGLRRVNRLDRRTAAEEVLAEMAQNTPQIGFVRRAVAAIRTWLRTNVPGFKSLALTDAELIRNFILPARAWVERGGAVSGQDGETSFSRDSREAPQTDVEKALVLQGEPVAEVDTAIAPMGAPAIRSWAVGLFEQQGGKAHNPALGDITLDGRSVRSSLAHGRPNAHKVAAFAAVKDVLEKGAVVLSARHGRDGDSFYVSAPVKVGEAVNIVTVLVKRDPNDQRMYLHSVATKKYLLDRRVSRTDTTSGVERSGSNDSGDTSTLAKQRDVGKASTEEVADELHRLLTLDTKSLQQREWGEAARSTKEKSPAAQWVDASAKADGQDLTSIRSTGDSNSLSEGLGRSDADEPMFSRTSATSMPDAIIGSTLGSASSHPDYAAAKAGDIEAAVRLAQQLVTPELVAKVKAAIGDSKPVVAPVAAEEATGRNRIPVAAAAVLAQRLGLATSGAIVQANRAHRTGMDGLDRIFASVDFAGAVEARPYLLVDDTLTQGGTFAALASHIREGGGTVAGVIALTGKQYSAKIQPSAETLASLRQKHGDLEKEFRAATGYGFDALTESEARYLARYEPADRLRDRISSQGHSGLAGEGSGNTGSGPVNDDPVFSRSRFADLKDSALDQLTKTFTHEGKVSLWDKSVGTMRHLAERAPSFKPVYESAQQNIDDVSMLANDAADMAPRILPRVESLGDLKKKPVSAADNKAVARPLFEGTLIWARDENGKPTLVDDLQKRYANLSAHNKAAMLLKHSKIDAGVLAMWQGLPVAQFEKLINSRFENKMFKPGIVWTDAELQAQFGTDANQISLYREARAAIDRSIDMTARTDMLRVVGEKYEPMRDAVLAQPSVEAAAQLLLDTLEQDAKADPDSRDRLAGYMQLINRRMGTTVDLQQGGYAPLSRFGRYTVDVVDANGERLYFGMYETARDSNRAKMQLAQEFQGATITTGTMSAEAYKLFAGVTPETLEQFGEMLGLKAEGNEAQDKAFQEFLKLTKNNHSAMKRLIHRKGIAGFSEDVGRVVANFVYSNARAGAMGLNAGKMETAIGKIPKEQGELKDLAMGLRDYIRDPQEEGQAVRGMLFAQYLGGSIASAFVNTTQPFAVTLPWLSQYGGMKKAGAQLARALKDMGRSVADKGFKYEADLAKALQSAEDDGVVSPQEIHQLMAQARGAGMLRSGDGTKAGDLRAKAGNLWEQGKVLWGQPFALAEQFNRRSTFIASYRIAKDQGMADPAEFARKAVQETQFVYSKANKMRFARGAVGGGLMTFKTYSVSYLELMHRMWTQGGPEGKRAVGWALAMLLLMSGAGGVPFMEDAEDLIDGAGQMMGYNISAKQWRKELLANVVGKELGEFMEQGLSGLPGAPIDVSGRLGMGNLLPGTGLFLDKPNRERDMTEIIGPAGDLVARGFSGARQVAKGVANWDGSAVGRGVLEWAPTAVRNLAKGVDMAATGMYRDTKGYKVIDTTLAEAAAKAIGFQPKSVAEVQEANSFMQRSKSFYTQTSSDIKAQWADALFRKDEAAVQRVRQRLADWNRDNPDQPIVVRMPDVWKRVREMNKDRSDRIADTAPKALREQMRMQVRELSN